MTISEISFTAIVSDDTTTLAQFEVDKSKTDTPTQSIIADPPLFRRGIIKEISYRLNPTNAETYTLMIFEDAHADNYNSNSRMLYESAALRADDTDYKIYCELPFNLDETAKFYVSTDWTGAGPGNTTGYIRISGIAYIG